MYWGFYIWYNSIFCKESVHKLHKNKEMFLCSFDKKIKKNKYGRSSVQLDVISAVICIGNLILLLAKNRFCQFLSSS